VKPHERIFVALDTPDAERAIELARLLAGRVGGLKVGLELFTAGGPDLVRRVSDLGLPVFLDLKLHDIPNTVAGAAASIGRLGVSFLTVHALGGTVMMQRAVEASHEGAWTAGRPAPVVLAVTILTSHDDAGLAAIGILGPCSAAVERLAALAENSGVGGLVCSPLEVTRARRVFESAVLVVPGIRPATAGPRPADDQARVATPGEAVAQGADRIVVGRPITGAPDPAAAADAVARDIAETAGR
jgi:orotidine-5'-phosphate decarboxylase